MDHRIVSAIQNRQRITLILDMRYMILYVLRSFDRQHSTGFFNTLTVSDIKVHENQIDPLVRTFVSLCKGEREEERGGTSQSYC